MFNSQARKSVILLGLAIALALIMPLRSAADDDDPPSRVARLSYAQGSVSFQPAGTDDWVSSVVNRPVTIGDKLWSDDDGRVELQLDGSLLRLSRNTGISFLNLSDNVTQIELSAGTLVIRVRRLDDDETYEVDTPNVAFSILRPGLYRISVDEQGQTTAIKVSSGQGEVTGGGTAYTVHAKENFSFAGTDQLDVYPEQYGNDEDQFDTWSSNRDAHWAHSRSAQYVSPDVVGYEDLDDHGDWRPTPEYGNVWFPRTRVEGWAPYHYGHWAYIEPWGYTWVDDEPWGFAPFHYGRWVSVRGAWGWVPSPPRAEGVVYVRPVYAPALVAWVGVGGGGAGVAWFALGPREVYVPSYHVSHGYVERVNVSNTRVETTVVNNYYNTTIVNKNVNVTNVTYVNQRVPGAVAATSSQAFTTSQPVARNAVKFDERAVASAPVRAFTPAEVPAKQAVLGTGRAVAVKPPAAVVTRAVVAKAPPPPPPPVFEKRQEAIKNNGGKPLSTAQVRQIQPAPAAQAAPVKIAPVAKAATPAQNAPPAPAGRNRNNPPAANQPAQMQPNQPNKPAAPAEANKPAQTQPNQPNRPPAPVEANKPATPPPAQPQSRPADRAAAPNNAAEPPAKQATPTNAAPPQNRPNDRPVTPNNSAQPQNRPPDRPAGTNNAVPPPNRPDNNRPAPAPARQENAPPAARPAPANQPNPQLEQKHQQEQAQLQAKQEQERQKIQRQQEAEKQRLAQQKADETQKQKLEQQHQQQAQQLQQKHAQEQQQLQEKQQKEKQQQESKNPPKGAKNDRPPNDKP